MDADKAFDWIICVHLRASVVPIPWSAAWESDMKKERNALRAGSFIFVTLALIGGIIVGIRGLGALEQQHTRTIAFTLRDDIGGLRIGDDVRVGGFRVGEVRKIELVSASDARVANRPADAPPIPDPDVLLVTVAIP